jgi:hypothetical protein
MDRGPAHMVYASKKSPTIVSSGRMTGKPEIIPLRREPARTHLILRMNMPGVLGGTR